MHFLLAMTAAAGLASGVNAQCKSMAAAAQEAGLNKLVDTITGLSELDAAKDLLAVVAATEEVEEKVTVFAPTDDGFTASKDTLDMAGHTATLNVILNHVVPGNFDSDTILTAVEADGLLTLETLFGPKLEAFTEGESLIVHSVGTNNYAKVVTADVETCAGTIHVVDTVLLPVDPEDPLALPTCKSIGDLAAEVGLTALADAVAAVKDLPEAAALIEAVTAASPTTSKVTLFAPENAGFEEISSVVEMLSPEQVLDVLLNHVVVGEFDASAIMAAIEGSAPMPAELETVLGTTLEATLDGNVTVTPAGTALKSTVVITDVQTCAGIVHVVKKVLVPSADAMMAPGPMAADECIPLDEAADAANLTALMDAVVAVSELEGAVDLMAAVIATEEVEEPLTVFAPTDAAFSAISGVLETLSPEDILNVLLNHIVAVELNSTEVVEDIMAAAPDPLEVDTLLNSTLEATLEGGSVILNPAGTDIMSKVVVTDVETCAGTVHVIDMVLVPAADSEAGPSTPSATTTDRGTAVAETRSGSFVTSATASVIALAGAAMMMMM